MSQSSRSRCPQPTKTPTNSTQAAGGCFMESLPACRLLGYACPCRRAGRQANGRWTETAIGEPIPSVTDRIPREPILNQSTVIPAFAGIHRGMGVPLINSEHLCDRVTVSTSRECSTQTPTVIPAKERHPVLRYGAGTHRGRGVPFTKTEQLLIGNQLDAQERML